MEATVVYWGNIGIMEKKMETTIVNWGNIGQMEMTSKLLYYIGVYWGYIGIKVLKPNFLQLYGLYLLNYR